MYTVYSTLLQRWIFHSWRRCIRRSSLVHLENSLDKINNLRPVKFKDKESGEYATGLIAEEVVNVLPELVFKRQIEGFKLSIEHKIPSQTIWIRKR